MLHIPALRQYHNSEFFRYMKQVTGFCEQNNPAALLLTPPLTGLTTAIAPLDQFFVPERSNIISAELVQLDGRRDAAITGIRALAGAYTYHFDPAISQAGQVLLAGIDKFGKRIQTLNYLAETEVLEGVVNDLLNDQELNTAVRTLKIENWVAELRDANALFNTRHMARTTDYAAQPGGNLLSLRATATDAYRVLAAHITAHDTLTPSDALTKLINELNSATDQFNALVAARGGGGEEEPEEPTEPPTDPTPPASE